MRKIIKSSPPPEWESFKEKHSNCNYDQLSSIEGGSEIRHILRKHLVAEQGNLCCYCQREIDDNQHSHNEHIKPRDRYPNSSMDYYNIVASCNDKGTCGSKKKSKYDPRKFVFPTDPDCEEHFRFLQDGRIDGDEKGKETIELLGLNQYSLVKSRRTVFKQCLEMAKFCGKEYVKEYYIDPDENGHLHPYESMVRYFYLKGYFDLNELE